MSRIFSIDVECVAYDRFNASRMPARVAVVDEDENLVLDCFVRPEVPVVSYLTQLTGLTEDILYDKGEDWATVLNKVKIALKPRGLSGSNPASSGEFVPTWQKRPVAILVGQNISKDIKWLQLQEGVDFQMQYDIAEFFAMQRPSNSGHAPVDKNPSSKLGPDGTALEAVPQMRKMYFSLRHVCKTFYGVDIQSGSHDPGIDSLFSIRLYKDYCLSPLYQDVDELNRLRSQLMSAPRTPSFQAEYGMHKYEGVCVGFRKDCPDCAEQSRREKLQMDI